MACPERGSSVLCEFYLFMSAIEVSRTDCQEFTNGLPTFFRTEKAHTRELLRCLLKKTFPLPAHKDWEVMGSSLGKLAICNRPPRANLPIGNLFFSPLMPPYAIHFANYLTAS